MVSFLCHLVVLFMFAPVLIIHPSAGTQKQFIFLGNMLSEGDVMPSPLCLAAGVSKTKRVEVLDFSKRGAPPKISPEAFKPNAAMPLPGRPLGRVVPVVVAGETQEAGRVAFGFLDFDQYLYQADFSDLKKAASRDEVAAAVDVTVTFDENGQVVQVSKSAGSGDPALDLALMHKLKKAVFRKQWIPAQRLLSVRIRLKE